MIKIAAFIELNKTINKYILKQKYNVKKKFGDQIYLNHPVHLTLFTININKIKDLVKLYQSEFTPKKKKFLIKITEASIFENDLVTNGSTLHYRVRKNKNLFKLQIDHLKYINKHISVLKTQKIKNINTILKKNYLRYGFLFAGNIWQPHVTVASIRNINKKHKFIKRFLKTRINLKCTVNEIKFYKINENKHKLLFSYK